MHAFDYFVRCVQFQAYTKNIQCVIHDTAAFLFRSSTVSYKRMGEFLQSVSSQDEPSFSQITKTCTPTRVADYLKHHREQAKAIEAVVTLQAAATSKESGGCMMKLLLQ
jgi:hypothetical protein